MTRRKKNAHVYPFFLNWTLLKKKRTDAVRKIEIMSEHTTTRGNDLKLFKRRFRLSGNAFSNGVLNVWNSLRNYVVLAPSLNIFKSRLNNHWRGNPIKFQPTCYIPGETGLTVRTRYRNGPLEAVCQLRRVSSKVSCRELEGFT